MKFLFPDYHMDRIILELVEPPRNYLLESFPEQFSCNFLLFLSQVLRSCGILIFESFALSHASHEFYSVLAQIVLLFECLNSSSSLLAFSLNLKLFHFYFALVEKWWSSLYWFEGVGVHEFYYFHLESAFTLNVDFLIVHHHKIRPFLVLSII